MSTIQQRTPIDDDIDRRRVGIWRSHGHQEALAIRELERRWPFDRQRPDRSGQSERSLGPNREAGLASVMFLMNSLGGGLSPGSEKTIEMHTVGGEERRTTPGGANTEVSSTCA